MNERITTQLGEVNISVGDVYCDEDRIFLVQHIVLRNQGYVAQCLYAGPRSREVEFSMGEAKESGYCAYMKEDVSLLELAAMTKRACKPFPGLVLLHEWFLTYPVNFGSVVTHSQEIALMVPNWVDMHDPVSALPFPALSFEDKRFSWAQRYQQSSVEPISYSGEVDVDQWVLWKLKYSKPTYSDDF